ncbi:DUF4352 domain-containing protein [Clostridium sp.]|uniref:DUF4352 domain-containing protein n=1 Tax=Clostridium sp. TaxID=1506 RepID=UPI0032169E7D
MKKRSKIYIGISVIFIIILGFCYSYHRVNLGVPREYNIQKYDQGKAVKLEDFEITGNGITKLEGSDEYNPGQSRYSYIVDLTIKNISDEDKDIKAFYRNNSLINESDLIKLSVPQEAVEGSPEVDAVLKSQEEIDIKLTFETSQNSKNDSFQYYFSKELYINEIKSDLENLKFLEKYIELSMEK